MKTKIFIFITLFFIGCQQQPQNNTVYIPLYKPEKPQNVVSPSGWMWVDNVWCAGPDCVRPTCGIDSNGWLTVARESKDSLYVEYHRFGYAGGTPCTSGSMFWVSKEDYTKWNRQVIKIDTTIVSIIDKIAKMQFDTIWAKIDNRY